eukprot:1980908-Rhodomonas_salina.3
MSGTDLAYGATSDSFAASHREGSPLASPRCEIKGPTAVRWYKLYRGGALMHSISRCSICVHCCYYAMRGTDVSYGATPYLPGTDHGHRVWCYAMSSTEKAYDTTVGGERDVWIELQRGPGTACPRP